MEFSFQDVDCVIVDSYYISRFKFKKNYQSYIKKFYTYFAKNNYENIDLKYYANKYFKNV